MLSMWHTFAALDLLSIQQNCWMLSSLVQDLLGTVGEASHTWGPVIHRNLWPVVRAHSKRRIHQFYNIPEPITVRGSCSSHRHKTREFEDSQARGALQRSAGCQEGGTLRYRAARCLPKWRHVGMDARCCQPVRRVGSDNKYSAIV